MATQVIMPEMGEGVTEATIIRWLKNEGDSVEKYEGLVEINTDKVDSEIPSPVAGVVLKIFHAPDTLIEVNQVLAWIGEKGEEVPEDAISEQVAPVVKAETPKTQVVEKTITPSTSKDVKTPPTNASWLNGVVSPLAAKVASELGIDPSQVRGTGLGGQVTKQDLLDFKASGGANSKVLPSNKHQQLNTFISPVVARLASENSINLMLVTGTGKDGRITKVDMQRVINAGGTDPIGFQKEQAPKEVYGGLEPGTLLKLNPVRRSIAKHMVESKKTSPHVSTFMDIDMSQVWEHRRNNKQGFAKENVHLTFTAYFVSALSVGLKQYPIVNSSWTEDGIQLHKDINIGVAVSLDAEGLIVPVIKQVDDMSLLGIARSINDLSGRARGKTLKPDEVRGGTFTITNHGTSGSKFAFPVINQPQCAILGAGLIEKRAVVIDDAIAIRPMITVGLTFDHRILDGAVADYFLASIKENLETW